jgi:5'-methylthioadenosine phosphorylase
MAEIGIIGGTGVYDPEFLKDSRDIKMSTPFGEPSDFVTIGNFRGREIAFIPRHAKGHRIPPHNINNRANIWALKELGVTAILAPAAVGSLKENIIPGDIVLPSQFIDRTSGRPSTFYEGGQVCHISMADPFCPDLLKLAKGICSNLNLRFHTDATYVCVQGPRFSTRAESRLFRSWGADIIGMTLVPECVLAREAEICYLPIATVTDFDVWAERPVSVDEVVATLKDNVVKTKIILEEIIPKIAQYRGCDCKNALKDALL